MTHTRSTTSLLNKALQGADLKIQGHKNIRDGNLATSVGAATLGAVGYIGIHALLVSNPITVGFVVGEIVGGTIGLIVTSSGIHDIKHGLSQVLTGDLIIDDLIIETTKNEAERLENQAREVVTQKAEPISNNVVMFTPSVQNSTTEKTNEVVTPKANFK